MVRTWLARAIASAHPAAEGEREREEIAATMLDAGDRSAVAFGREATSVVLAAVAGRSRRALHRPVGELGGDILRYATILMVARDLATTLTVIRWGERVPSPLITTLLVYVGPALILVLFSVGRDRVTGAVGLVWLAVVIGRAPAPDLLEWIALWVLPLAGFALMLIRPAAQPGLRLLWLLPALVCGLFWFTELGLDSGVGYVTPVLASVALITVAPEVAIGTAVSWTLLAAEYMQPGVVTFEEHLWIQLLACAPIMIGLVISARLRSGEPTRG